MAVRMRCERCCEPLRNQDASEETEVTMERVSLVTRNLQGEEQIDKRIVLITRICL